MSRWKHQPELLTLALAVALTYVFFPTLWRGGGLVGGDIYPYFFPQKQFYAEALRAGEIPLWNHRTGNGYPTVGESQTGVFYPFHLLYRFCRLNTAYHSIQLAHYVIAFWGAWLLARRWGIRPLPACLAAIVYTYGWMPPRMCVEWAALTAAWFPLAIWSLETYLQTARRGYLLSLSIILAVQMLAGHFHLAFITQVVITLYLPLRLWIEPALVAPDILSHRLRSVAICIGAILCGFGAAAIQLGPTWELKQLSQRAALGAEHDPGYGFIPWWYLGQMIAPWSYYVPGLSLSSAPGAGSRTNTVEAHLYCGLLPLVLAVAGCFVSRSTRDRRQLIWWLLGGLALVYATGSLMPIARHLPGFGFFNGVGRYGVVVNLAAGILAADALQRLTETRRIKAATAISMIAVALTLCDFWWVSRLIQHSVMVATPPIQHLESSPIRRALAGADQPVRLFCRGANVPNLLGVSSTPVYLGIGPQAYFDPRVAMPQPLPYDAPPTAEQVAWLRRAGVTHVLSFQPLDITAWPIQQVLASPDPFLNRVWGRGLHEMFFLYSLDEARGRAYWQSPQAGDVAKITEIRANRVTAAVESVSGGTLVLSDLDWPGWQTEIDGQRVAGLAADYRVAPYRGVNVPAGRHQIVWTYRPACLWWGAVVSILTSLVLALIAVLPRFRR